MYVAMSMTAAVMQMVFIAGVDILPEQSVIDVMQNVYSDIFIEFLVNVNWLYSI